MKSNLRLAFELITIIYLISIISSSSNNQEVNSTNAQNNQNNSNANEVLNTTDNSTQADLQGPKTFSDEIEDQIKASSNEDWEEDNEYKELIEEETDILEKEDPIENLQDKKNPDNSTWEKELSEFEPTDLLTILISSRSKEYFYINMTDVPSPLQIAIFVIEEDSEIDFTVYNPDDTRLVIRKSMNHDFFNLVAVMQGEYKIALHNQSVS